MSSLDRLNANPCGYSRSGGGHAGVTQVTIIHLGDSDNSMVKGSLARLFTIRF